MSCADSGQVGNKQGTGKLTIVFVPSRSAEPQPRIPHVEVGRVLAQLGALVVAALAGGTI